MDKAKLKKLPPLLSDAEAERFVDEADLSAYDLSGFKAKQFAFSRKSERVNVRLPGDLLAAVKAESNQS